MTATAINTKIKEVDNKIPNLSSLVKKTDYDAKISDIQGKYFTTSDYNKFTGDIFDAKIKQKELVNKSDICNLVKNSDLNTILATLATKTELKEEPDKIVRLQTFDLSYFIGKIFYVEEDFQHMLFFIKQPVIH